MTLKFANFFSEGFCTMSRSNRVSFIIFAVVLKVASGCGEDQNKKNKNLDAIGQGETPAKQIDFDLSWGEAGLSLNTVIAVSVSESYTICTTSAPGGMVYGNGFGVAIQTSNMATFSLNNCRLAVVKFVMDGKTYTNPKVNSTALPLSLNGSASMALAHPLLASGGLIVYEDQADATKKINVTIAAQPQWNIANGVAANTASTSASYTLPVGAATNSGAKDSTIVSKAFTFSMMGVGAPNPVSSPDPFVVVGFNNGEAQVGSLNFPFTTAFTFANSDRWTSCYWAEGSIGANVAASSFTDMASLQNLLATKTAIDINTGEGLYCTSLSGFTGGARYSFSIGRNDPMTRFPRSYSFVYFRRSGTGTTMADLRQLDTTANVVHGLLHVKLGGN
jgi:hypothetical protein